MKRSIAWLGSNSEALVALSLALVITVLDVANLTSPGVVGSATLLVLALLSFALLRDRWRRESTERGVAEGMNRLGDLVDDLPAQLRRIADLEDVVERSRMALDEGSAVRAIAGSEVGRALAEARQNTDRWIFKGGTGTYLRAVTMPECIENARRERRALLLRLEILDPTDLALCTRYARLRQSLSNQPDGTGERWTVGRVRNEAYATILAACWYHERFDLLDVTIGLAKTMTTFRWDLSAHRVIITQEDPRSPAALVESGRFFYDCISTELRSSMEQARRVAVEKATDVPLSDEPTVEEVTALFAAIGVDLPESCSHADVEDIVRRAIHASNPYA